MTHREPQPIHLRPTAELAERVLLPGDPGRALALAQTLISEPRMFNHHRGLWGYTGSARADGEPLTIQSTGIGGPSAAIILTELIALGARRAIRVGTCGALVPELALGDLVIAREAICQDGTSRALGAGERVGADLALTEALVAGAPAARAGAIVSVDLFYETALTRAGARTRVSPAATILASSTVHTTATTPSDPAAATSAAKTPATLAVEMEAATLLALGARAQIPVACALVVSDTFDANGARTRIDDSALLAAAESIGAVAVAALAA